MMSGRPDSYLPVAHTCKRACLRTWHFTCVCMYCRQLLQFSSRSRSGFFELDLPRYSSKAVLREKLLFAMQNCTTIDVGKSGPECFVRCCAKFAFFSHRCDARRAGQCADVERRLAILRGHAAIEKCVVMGSDSCVYASGACILLAFSLAVLIDSMHRLPGARLQAAWFSPN